MNATKEYLRTCLLNINKVNHKVMWLKSMNKRISGAFSVPGVKTALNLMGYRAGIPRRPLKPLSTGEIEEVRAALLEAGALKE